MTTLDFLLSDDTFDEELKEKVLPFIEAHKHPLMVSGMDGMPLNAYTFDLENSDRVVCISHGYCEFICKYSEVIYYFLKAGYSVAMVEHRGHGFSSRMLDNLCKVHIDDFDTYVRDYHCFVNAVKGHFGPKDYYLFAHSMGGCIGTLYLERYPEVFRAAVLSSPMLDIHANGLPKDLCLAYGKVYTAVRDGERLLGSQDQGFDGNAKFEDSNASEYHRWNAWYTMRKQERYYQTCNGTIEWITASLAAIREALKNAAAIRTPFLMCQAGLDTLVPAEGQNEFMEMAETGAVLHFPDAKHEIYNSPKNIREAYWHAVCYFLEAF